MLNSLSKSLPRMTLGIVLTLVTSGGALAAEVPCGACHAEAAAAFGATPHGKALDGAPCSVCHGDGTEHLSAPSAATILAFDEESAEEQNAVCTSCHRETELAQTSAHSAAGMACTSCHSVHDAGKKKAL